MFNVVKYDITYYTLKQVVFMIIIYVYVKMLACLYYRELT